MSSLLKSLSSGTSPRGMVFPFSCNFFAQPLCLSTEWLLVLFILLLLHRWWSVKTPQWLLWIFLLVHHIWIPTSVWHYQVLKACVWFLYHIWGVDFVEAWKCLQLLQESQPSWFLPWAETRCYSSGINFQLSRTLHFDTSSAWGVWLGVGLRYASWLGQNLHRLIGIQCSYFSLFVTLGEMTHTPLPFRDTNNVLASFPYFEFAPWKCNFHTSFSFNCWYFNCLFKSTNASSKKFSSSSKNRQQMPLSFPCTGDFFEPLAQVMVVINWDSLYNLIYSPPKVGMVK